MNPKKTFIILFIAATVFVVLFTSFKNVVTQNAFKEYRILGGNDQVQLQQSVNNAIQEGWQPVGGVSVGSVSTVSNRIYQAMVK